MYKFTRKQCLKKLEMMPESYSFKDFWKDLLAQKEDRKECNCSCHQLNPVAFACTECQKNHPTPSPEKECKHEGDKTDWHPQFCRKCGAEFMYDFLPPSPLEIEEIPEIKRMIVYPDICEDLAKVVKEIVENQNTLISNQKKLYQYIKEKKI